MSIRRLKVVLLCVCVPLLLLFLLAACNSGSSGTPVTPVPTTSPGANSGTQLLTQAGQKLNDAHTLHALVSITIVGPAANGTIRSELWSLTPNESRSLVQQSNISQLAAGTLTVSDGQQVWQYNPGQKVAYHATITSSGTATPTTGQVPTDQGQVLFNLVRSVFTKSNATLVSSTASINGRPAYDIAITSPATTGGSGTNNLNYSGDIFLDKTTTLPLHVSLHVQGLGQITLDFLLLTLNQQLDQSLFTFTPPPGVKVLPFPTSTSASGGLTLAQAQQQAGYHLLSIPTSATSYTLLSVKGLGAPGNQVYTLTYKTSTGVSFTIAQSKALANLPVSGQSESLRGTTATYSTAGSAPSLTWTEHGVGIQIVGNLTNSQMTTIAKLLS